MHHLGCHFFSRASLLFRRRSRCPPYPGNNELFWVAGGYELKPLGGARVIVFF